MLYHSQRKKIKSKNVRNFTTREEVNQYLANTVFNSPHFVSHIEETANKNQVSYMLAYEVITNHLTDILYEIDKNITLPKKKVKIRVYSYFSLRIGFMISSTKTRLIELHKQNKKRKRNERK